MLSPSYNFNPISVISRQKEESAGSPVPAFSISGTNGVMVRGVVPGSAAPPVTPPSSVPNATVSFGDFAGQATPTTNSTTQMSVEPKPRAPCPLYLPRCRTAFHL
jgi:hypothetical protein